MLFLREHQLCWVARWNVTDECDDCVLGGAPAPLRSSVEGGKRLFLGDLQSVLQEGEA